MSHKGGVSKLGTQMGLWRWAISITAVWDASSVFCTGIRRRQLDLFNLGIVIVMLTAGCSSDPKVEQAPDHSRSSITAITSNAALTPACRAQASLAGIQEAAAEMLLTSVQLGRDSNVPGDVAYYARQAALSDRGPGYLCRAERAGNPPTGPGPCMLGRQMIRDIGRTPELRSLSWEASTDVGRKFRRAVETISYKFRTAGAILASYCKNL